MGGFSAVGVAFSLLISSQQTEAGIGVSGKVGFPGFFSIEVTKSLRPVLNARAGLLFWPEGLATGGVSQREEGGNWYDERVTNRLLGLFVDLHPIPSAGLRLTGGLLHNATKEEWVSLPARSYEIGHQAYTADEVGELRGGKDYRTLAPYFGIGWGNAAQSRRRISFAVDLGILYSGRAKLHLAATGPIASQPGFVDSIRREVDDLQKGFDGDGYNWRFYPFVLLGISVKLSG